MESDRSERDSRVVAWGLRLLAAIALIVGIGIGCSLPRSGLGTPGEFSCESWIISADGHRERVSSRDTEFDTLLVRNFCTNPGGMGITAEEVWRHHLGGVLAAGPFRGHDGGVRGWCVLNTTCSRSRDFTEHSVPACPDLTGTTPLRDDCALGSSCVQVAPEPLLFPATNLSEVAPVGSVSFENACSESRFLRADETIFDDPLGQFAVTDNGCVTTDPVAGRELTPFGTAADGCVVELRFTPKDPGAQSAEYRTSVADDGVMITTTLQGEGVGTAPRSITGAPRVCLDPGPGDCASTSVGVVSDGPSGFRITATDFEFVAGTGFAAPTGPGAGEIFAPGAEARYEIEWCRSRSSLPSERLQLSITTTTANPGETRTFRVTADAPPPCP